MTSDFPENAPNAEHFFLPAVNALHTRISNTEPFRMTLEDTGFGYRCLLWAGFLCDKVHH
ncbi:hypothetical protein FXR45_13780 [Salmonella enterica]|nr:hypothetical protein [Salmonella enterica]